MDGLRTRIAKLKDEKMRVGLLKRFDECSVAARDELRGLGAGRGLRPCPALDTEMDNIRSFVEALELE